MGAIWRAYAERYRGMQPMVRWAFLFAWAIAFAALINVLSFVLLTANPVIRSDEWYALDVLVRKAITGNLGVADFFLRRNVTDHAQPLQKLAVLLEWRYFDLDFVVESILGVVAAAACAMILYRIVMVARPSERADANRYLAWATMVALLFSLNACGIWTWPLVAFGYVTVVPILLFMAVAWHAWHSRRYLLLALVTLLLCLLADDSALITVTATIVALLICMLREPATSRAAFWKVVAVILVCTALVRIGYAFAPLSDITPGPGLTTRLVALSGRLREGDGWQWLTVPLSLSVAYDNPFHNISAKAWAVIQTGIAVCLLIAHGVFWWRALSARHNLPTFIAVCLMLLSYGLLAGIILVRVSLFGSGYLGQDRYVEFYQFNLIALLLMWSGNPNPESSPASWRWLTVQVPMVACVALLVLQIPLSHAAWQQRRYLLPYYGRMAVQVGQLAEDPAQTKDCLPELVVCQWPLDRRRGALRLLSTFHLNVLSPRVQAWHPFLPQFATSLEGTSSHRVEPAQ
jgi:hypothetical protein